MLIIGIGAVGFSLAALNLSVPTRLLICGVGVGEFIFGHNVGVDECNKKPIIIGKETWKKIKETAGCKQIRATVTRLAEISIPNSQ